MLGELLLEAEGCHWALQDLAQLCVWQDAALVIGVLEIILFHIRPDCLHNLQANAIRAPLVHYHQEAAVCYTGKWQSQNGKTTSVMQGCPCLEEHQSQMIAAAVEVRSDLEHCRLALDIFPQSHAFANNARVTDGSRGPHLEAIHSLHPQEGLHLRRQ